MQYKKVALSIILIFLILIGNFLPSIIKQYFSNDIEEKAVIVISVESILFGDAIVKLWNETYPQHKGVVEYRVVGDYFDISTDIIYGRMDEIFAMQNQCLSFSNSYFIYDSMRAYYLFSDGEVIFHPMYFEGLVFAYNETMLRELGISTLDGNGDGLPEAVDSFEKLFLLAEQWKEEPPIYKEKELEFIFPFVFNDRGTVYPFLTAGGWNLENPKDFEFLAALEFIYELGNYKWSFKGEIDSWQYEQVMKKESAPFSLVGDWMYYERYQIENQAKIRYAKFPTYQGRQLKSLVNIYGYSINGDTKYPRAAMKLMNLLQSNQGYQIVIDYGEHIAVIPEEVFSNVNIDDQRMIEWMKAYEYSQLAPYGVVEGMYGLDQYYPVEFMEIVERLFRHKIEPSEASQWMEEWKNDWQSAE